MVHGIPCVELPPAPKESNYSEASLWERAKWSRSLRERKQLKISSPIWSPEDDDSSNLIPPPIEKDEKYVSRSGIWKPSLRLEVVNSSYQCTVQDVSPSFKMSSNRTNNPFVEPESSPLSPRGRPRYPGVTKIPEDLPCHQRYIPLTRSRSTRVLESQMSRTVTQGTDEDNMNEDGAWSDSSSVYSQESFEQHPYRL
jgi:hypothetical protein